MLKINHLRLQNRKIFFGLAFGAARLRSRAASVQNQPLRARNRKVFFGLAPALRVCARRPRPAATDGWREGPTPQSVRRNMRKRGTATPSHAAVLGSNLLCRLSKFHKQLIHCFQMEGTSGAPRKGASRDIHFATIFENRSKIGPKSANNAPRREFIANFQPAVHGRKFSISADADARRAVG